MEMLRPTPEQSAERNFRLMIESAETPLKLAVILADCIRQNPAGLRGLLAVYRGNVYLNVDVVDWISDIFPDAHIFGIVKEVESRLV